MSIGATKLFDVPLKVWDASLAITMFGHHFEGFFLWKILLWPFIEIFVLHLHSFMNISYWKSQKNLRASLKEQKITQNIALFSDKVVNKTPKITKYCQLALKIPMVTRNTQQPTTYTASKSIFALYLQDIHFSW